MFHLEGTRMKALGLLVYSIVSNTRLFVEALENGDKQKEENTKHS